MEVGSPLLSHVEGRTGEAQAVAVHLQALGCGSWGQSAGTEGSKELPWLGGSLEKGGG